jgi:hypothetical protein
MTDEELNKVRKSMLDAPKSLDTIRAYGKLTAEERERMQQLASEESNAKIQKLFAKMEADGSLNKIRESYARDQDKKKRK